MRNTVLIVDDAEMNRELLCAILEDDYETEQAENGIQALEIMRERQDQIDAVLLDLQMPELDGFGVIDEMREKDWIKSIPVLIISAERAVDVENKCFELGVADFIHKPFEPSLVKNRVRNTVDLFAYKNHLEQKVEAQTEKLREQNKTLAMQAERLQETNERIIEVLGTVVECRNLESGEHVKRVKDFTRVLAYQIMEDYPEYGLNETSVDMIAAASALHDVGKIAIPDKVLLKPGRLTDEEFALMKTHTTQGSDLLEQIEGIWDDDYQKTSYEICRHHHERYDGRGYPDGLKGEDIPISAQIVSVADVYDALVCECVYKAAFPKDKAFEMILNGECGTFSPKLMESFKKVKEKFEKLVG